MAKNKFVEISYCGIWHCKTFFSTNYCQKKSPIISTIMKNEMKWQAVFNMLDTKGFFCFFVFLGVGEGFKAVILCLYYCIVLLKVADCTVVWDCIFKELLLFSILSSPRARIQWIGIFLYSFFPYYWLLTCIRFKNTVNYHLKLY